jgi:hypothetical protein
MVRLQLTYRVLTVVDTGALDTNVENLYCDGEALGNKITFWTAEMWMTNGQLVS